MARESLQTFPQYAFSIRDLEAAHACYMVERSQDLVLTLARRVAKSEQVSIDVWFKLRSTGIMDILWALRLDKENWWDTIVRTALYIIYAVAPKISVGNYQVKVQAFAGLLQYHNFGDNTETITDVANSLAEDARVINYTDVETFNALVTCTWADNIVRAEDAATASNRLRDMFECADFDDTQVANLRAFIFQMYDISL
jgi:hypothetical protein